MLPLLFTFQCFLCNDIKWLLASSSRALAQCFHSVFQFEPKCIDVEIMNEIN